MAGAPDEPRHDHRVVTALVASIVGSRQIASALDPEDAHELLGRVVEVMIREVDALDGTVSDLGADGILALFGAPVAHEDDAIRGVLCGLRIVEALAEYTSTLPRSQVPDGPTVRIGVESGRVVAGPIGAGSRVEYGATGDALTTATVLQSLALPNSVLVGPTTRAMAGDAFIWAGGAGYRLPNTAAQISVDTALAFTPNGREQRATQKVPLVGRVGEVATLRDAAERTSDGHGSVLVVVGSAGTGKSRLVDELHDITLGRGSWTWLEAVGASYSQSIPLSSYRSMSLRLAGLTEDAHRQEFGPAMEALASTASAAVAESIHSLLRALGPGEWDTVVARSEGGDPAAARDRIFEAICDLAEALANERPTAVVLEDLHWMDPTSITLTHGLAERSTRCPLLLVITTRAEPDAIAEVASLGDRLGERISRIDLRPLTRDDNRALLRARLRGGRLPLRVEEDLLDTTDGNPYFLLEQVRGLVERGALTPSADGLRLVEGQQLELATTLEQALTSRIDRLSPEDRRTLVAASVLGLQFDGAQIDDLVGANATESLRRLVELDFLVLMDQAGDAGTWLRFQHALVRQAAYGGALKRERRMLHLRAANALEASYASRTDEIASILGRHLSEAGEVHRAVPYLLRAARSAEATYSNEEAATLAHKALDLLGAALSDDDREAAVELARIETAATRQLARYDAAISAQRRLMSFIPASEAVSRLAVGRRAQVRRGSDRA
jgi:adenylate cyclase